MKTVTLEFIDSIAILTLNRPEVLNSMVDQLAIDAREALAEVRTMSNIRALVLTGAGRAFCAGAELNDTLLNGSAEQPARAYLDDNMRLLTNPWIQDLHDFPIPVIAAVNGVAAGAGVGLALAADITVAAQSASFILNFSSKLGLIPDVGVTWHLSRRIGLARATALALLGNKLTAEKAVEWGLIWECVADDQLHHHAITLAQTLANAPRHAALELRQALHYAQSNTLPQQLDYERQRQCVLVETAAFREGVNAFKEKRKPNFD
ncbi:enoyl-CoA hydratase-related protein [Acinetobacter baumannii]|uniref:enoyl-CoA hydratase-related protein n=1 Tax=Acinetobacter baumannii TaxID=470 RepID=UPI0029570F10|nr:enoyl-CoA hydratase-related protein [Acinetobacter baumannii]MDV7609572.1 enoyl-CoA hydratase-related protein [Acinetobacter baumannii]MDV7611363.1 enoyl-CoA hydratase-related protein [Acinetobacter baumannii]MDV7615572.1 enoyl-CoA hydratase-related protein [Acinetobacter baumannii]